MFAVVCNIRTYNYIERRILSTFSSRNTQFTQILSGINWLILKQTNFLHKKEASEWPIRLTRTIFAPFMGFWLRLKWTFVLGFGGFRWIIQRLVNPLKKSNMKNVLSGSTFDKYLVQCQCELQENSLILTHQLLILWFRQEFPDDYLASESNF